MHSEVLNPRRAPRAAHRCAVDVRDRRTSWRAETEDIGPRGCQLVTPRLAAPGRELRLTIRCSSLGQALKATARVVWTSAATPSRLGLEFLSGQLEPGWFDVLLGADPSAVRPVRQGPERLSRAARLHLGDPPRYLADFSVQEVAVLRRIGPGLTVGELATSLGPAFERVRGALFSLVSRRLVVLTPGEAIAPERWQPVLAAAERGFAEEGIDLPGPSGATVVAPVRSPAAQALFHEGMAHLSAGRVALAVARLREAQLLSPGDAQIAGALTRLAPWV